MAKSENTNLTLWENMRQVDRKLTKPITGKSYRGDSPNPTYIIRKLTEQLGPIGQSWGFEVKFDRVRLGAPHQVVTARQTEYGPKGEDGTQAVLSKQEAYEIIREEYHEVCIAFWQKNGETGEITKFDAYGGTPMLYMTRKGTWMHDEDAAKKSLTDAYVKAASWLGAAADIFLGIFDDKYSANPDESAAVRGQNGQGMSSEGGSTGQPQNSAPDPAQGERKSSAGDVGW